MYYYSVFVYVHCVCVHKCIKENKFFFSLNFQFWRNFCSKQFRKFFLKTSHWQQSDKSRKIFQWENFKWIWLQFICWKASLNESNKSVHNLLWCLCNKRSEKEILCEVRSQKKKKINQWMLFEIKKKVYPSARKRKHRPQIFIIFLTCN